jgi:hypothetical protein
MKDKKEIEQLRAEYIEAKMATMIDDCEGASANSEMAFYAEKGLEIECNGLTFVELEALMIELAELNGEDEDDEEDEDEEYE